ncbi:MAG: ribonuclease III [Burkholderiales bacterium]|nr:ribonuclease III [Burkholderiales bacterium]
MPRTDATPAASSPLKALQKRLGYEFSDSRLLVRALTHKSFGQDHYERLEFLGDAVLNLAVSGMLYARFGRSDEGEMTRVRAHLVRQDMLHKLAVGLDFPTVMRMSEGEARGGGAQRPSILADAIEAVIGAIYLDAGFEQASALVLRLFEPVMAETTLEVWSKDAKTALQEWLQGRKMAVPIYRIEATRGKAHEQVFVVACELPTLDLTVHGEGLSRRAAEQVAAELALRHVRGLTGAADPGGPAANAPTVVVKPRKGKLTAAMPSKRD